MKKSIIAAISALSLLYSACTPFIPPPQNQQKIPGRNVVDIGILIQAPELRLRNKEAQDFVLNNLGSPDFRYDFLQGPPPSGNYPNNNPEDTTRQFYKDRLQFLQNKEDGIPFSIGFTERDFGGLDLRIWHPPAAPEDSLGIQIRGKGIDVSFCVEMSEKNVYAFKSFTQEFSYGGIPEKQLLEDMLRSRISQSSSCRF